MNSVNARYPGTCHVCQTDAMILKTNVLPLSDPSWPAVRIADLFSGCGGLSLGIQRAAHDLQFSVDVRLAVDSDNPVLDVYKATFPTAETMCSPIEELFDGCIGSPPTRTEANLAYNVGQLDVLLGGPPCQGHSNLNNHSRRDDPRNGLYLSMARAADVLRPSAVIIENVPTVTMDTRKVVKKTVEGLGHIGYIIGQGVVNLSNLGVPQNRRRHVILAVRPFGIDPQALIERLTSPVCDHVPRSVKWAIEDLKDIEESDLFNSPSQPSDENQSRIDWLVENSQVDLPNRLRPTCHRSDHSYTAMYGRISWDIPAQTITTGFNCIGQGRYIHPSQSRVITPHEAARLQMIPDFVDLRTVSTRKNLGKIIGNFVPPPLSFAIGRMIIPSLKTMDLSGDRNVPALEEASSRDI